MSNRAGSFTTELVQEKSFLYDVEDEKSSNREIVQKAWEDVRKDVECEVSY